MHQSMSFLELKRGTTEKGKNTHTYHNIKMTAQEGEFKKLCQCHWSTINLLFHNCFIHYCKWYSTYVCMHACAKHENYPFSQINVHHREKNGMLIPPPPLSQKSLFALSR